MRRTTAHVVLCKFLDQRTPAAVSYQCTLADPVAHEIWPLVEFYDIHYQHKYLF